MQINISHDIDAAIRDVDGFFAKDVPFAVSTAMNTAAFAARHHIVNVTWGRAFNVRNARFPGLLWRVETVARSALKEFKTGVSDSMVVTIRQQQLPSRGGGSPDRGYTATHALGGTKVASDGGNVAIPVEKNIRRNKGGGVSKTFKPRAVLDRKGGFRAKGRGGTEIIFSKNRKGNVTARYVLKRSTKINKSFRFFEDGLIQIERSFDTAFTFAIARAIKSNRVFSSR